MFYKWGDRVRKVSRYTGKKMSADGAEKAEEEEKEPI
jgi:hypothetical protein